MIIIFIPPRSDRSPSLISSLSSIMTQQNVCELIYFLSATAWFPWISARFQALV